MASTKVLVANRSEIACRIFQACREKGLRTVGIVAPGDEEARHVSYADELIPVKSYLDVDAVLAAVQKSGARWVHPGYGFLSERPVFVEALESAGVGFVGPRSASMRAMGDKIAAKKLAENLGVPTLPWAQVSNTAELKAAASRIGFPLLLKASAGGGGKGMRRVDRIEDLEAASESASAEARAAFGDGTLFLERAVLAPRHIEVQVFGDGKGAGVALHERECTMQRRHQKIWEEARAPRLSETTRAGLAQAALHLVSGTQYLSAGTIEFLVDAEENFYFLEMNTRLQVEHPVTELITGIDLVHAQLDQALHPDRAALTQTPEARGHAIEVRVYTEDPSRGYVPTPGRIEKLRFPLGPGIRVDSGIEEGQTVGVLFDSMLAKLIVHAPTRDLALARMRYALSETVILGSGGFASNQSFLMELAQSALVQSGAVTTATLQNDFGQWIPQLSPSALQGLSALLQGGGTPQRQAEDQKRTRFSPWMNDWGGSP